MVLRVPALALPDGSQYFPPNSSLISPMSVCGSGPAMVQYTCGQGSVAHVSFASMSFSFLCHPAPGHARYRSRGSPKSVSLPYGKNRNTEPTHSIRHPTHPSNMPSNISCHHHTDQSSQQGTGRHPGPAPYGPEHTCPASRSPGLRGIFFYAMPVPGLGIRRHDRPGQGYPTPCPSRAVATRRHAASGRRRRIAANGGAGRK